MGKVTGLGGVFLKAKDPKALSQWYETHLGIKREPHGSFEFSAQDVISPMVLSFFAEDSDYFGTGGQRAMLNLQVVDLDGLLDSLIAAGEVVDPKRDVSEYGKFGWFTDPEGNRVELWEPPAAG